LETRQGQLRVPRRLVGRALRARAGAAFSCRQRADRSSRGGEHAYCDYERAIDSALFANYTETQSVDGFIPHALAQIVASGTGADASYRYVQ
jgi:hypothetical protein